MQLARYDLALESYARAADLRPDFVLYPVAMGDACVQLGRYEEALDHYSRAIEITPTFPGAWSSRGSVHGKLGQWSKALADHAKATELSPYNAYYLNAQAWLLATCPEPELRNATRSVELAKKAAALAPADGSILNTLCVAHYRHGDWQEAVVTLQRAMALRNGGDSTDWFFLALAYDRLGKRDEAQRWFAQAVEWMDRH